MSTSEAKESKEVDIYRDTPVRLLGYSNEVGEAFRALVPVSFVRLSYGIASAYVLADTYDKSSKMSKQTFATEAECRTKVACAAADTLLWQAFASVIIPGFAINRLCKFSLFLLKSRTRLPLATSKWITTAIGLSSIPFIVKPIDTAVDYVMDNSARKYLGTLEEHQKKEHQH